MSLRHLGLERIPLFQLHRIDPQVPFEDQIGELKNLRDEGKIGFIGLSEVTVGELTAAQEIAPIATVQNLYNLANRKAEDLLNYSAAHSIGFIPWFPLATGRARQARRAAGRPGHQARRLAVAAGAGLAAAPLAGDAADPGHVARGAPVGKRHRRADFPVGRRIRRPRGRRQVGRELLCYVRRVVRVFAGYRLRKRLGSSSKSSGPG